MMVDPGPEVRLVKWEHGEKSSYADNYVRTSKYTAWNFVPKNLFDQFRRMANFYFLVIAILQSIPDISPLSPFTAIAPLVFVVVLGMLKDAIEDYHRYKSDLEENNNVVLVLRDGAFQSLKWMDVIVGDICKVECNQFFPADLVLLNSSAEKGSAYVDTCNLDGETNLKSRSPVKSGLTLPLLAGGTLDDSLRHFQSEYLISCGLPDEHLYKFQGALTAMGGRSEGLDAEQMLLRGSMLKNTAWALGVAVYTGHESKIMKNGKSVVFKQSNVDKATNRLIVLVFLLQCVLCCLCGILASDWTSSNGDKAAYLMSWEYFDGDAAVVGMLAYLSYVVLLNTLIPISLMVSVEVVKLVQALFINADVHMRDAHAPEEGKPVKSAEARTSALNEELGQVHYIFSDKTGTLTENRMEFRGCSVGGATFSADGQQPPGSATYDALERRCREERGGVADMFMTVMSACHAVVVEDPNGQGPAAAEAKAAAGQKLGYNSDSPDETALVQAAAALGYTFVGANGDNVMSVLVRGERAPRRYQLLHALAFTSARKRMSVVLRRVDEQAGAEERRRYMVLCKGADNVVLKLVEPNPQLVPVVVEQLRGFAAQGLRTLCLAYRMFDEQEYQRWAAMQHQAEMNMGDREAALEESARALECRLQLLGATAIEDKLQTGVPETIEKLARAGIKLWVLTGDKQETAIEIGRSCRLITPEMTVLILNAETQRDFERELNDKKAQALTLPEVKPGGGATGNANAAPNGGNGGSGGAVGAKTLPAALIIDGATLVFAMSKEQDFLSLALVCQSVILCRSSPLQKAQVVQLVRAHTPGCITLSIGDGANDVPMLKAAHVGVGVSGQEGMQAVMNSDYAIRRFHHLERLLLHHGRLSYIRIANLITYFFYKNATFTLCLFYFAFYCAFSAQSLFSDFYISMFNMTFTAAPVVFRACMEQDTREEVAARYPQLYFRGQTNADFGPRQIARALFTGLLHSLVIFFVPLLALARGRDGLLGPDQATGVGLWELGLTSFTAVIITVTLKIALQTRHFTWINHFGYWASLAFFFIASAGYDSVAAESQGAFGRVLGSDRCMYSVFLAVFLCLLPSLARMGWEECFSEQVQPLHAIRQRAEGKAVGAGDAP